MEPSARLFRDLPDAVRLVARDGSVLMQNDAARLFGEPALDHLCGGKNVRPDPSCPSCQLAEVFDKGLFLRWHVTVPQDSGALDYYEVTLCPVRDDAGRVVSVLEIARDATATLGVEQYLIGRVERQDVEIQRRLEELGTLKKTQTELVYRDRLTALSLLVASLSHEIHTPLGAMLSSADLLERIVGRLESEPGAAPEEKVEKRLRSLREAAAVMVEGARRIQGVVRTLRLFSRLDEAVHKQVDLHEGLDSTLQLLQYRMEGRVRVVRRYGDLPKITCRPDACNQVFMNLLLNSVQAIEGEGEIRIRTRREGDEALIEIADDGVGIPEGDLPRVFELGFTTRASKAGAGIGLALSRRIVEEHGGTLQVVSRPGAGATFTIRLPLTPMDREEGR